MINPYTDFVLAKPKLKLVFEKAICDCKTGNGLWCMSSMMSIPFGFRNDVKYLTVNKLLSGLCSPSSIIKSNFFCIKYFVPYLKSYRKFFLTSMIWIIWIYSLNLGSLNNRSLRICGFWSPLKLYAPSTTTQFSTSESSVFKFAYHDSISLFCDYGQAEITACIAKCSTRLFTIVLI